jgi:ribonuclease D
MRYVDNPSALVSACEACASRTAVGLDTEFERSRTYYPRPALLQLTDDDQTWLIDPLALPDLAALAGLLTRDSPCIVMHSAPEDLEVLFVATGRQPSTLFDTQLAAGLAGLSPGLGYHALVRDLLDVEVSKDQTRSDWLRRPLSEAQLHYAATDVAYLLALRDRLSERLRALGRLSWLDEDTTRLCARAARDDGSRRDFERLADRTGADDRARGRLSALCEWREQTARRRDRPRRHVASDQLLVALALSAPSDRAALEALPEWTDRGTRRQVGATAVLEALADADGAPPLPPPLPDLTPHRGTLDSMRRVVAARASALELEPSVLASRRLLEKTFVEVCIHGRDLPEELRGWRAEHLETPIMECLRNG